MDKRAALIQIATEIENCKVCKNDKTGLAVPGEGNPDAKVMFVGEAPGKTEAKTGRPFVGRSGQLLRKLIGEIGLREEEVFITSPVKYLPKRGTPTPADIKHGKTHLNKQIDAINPAVLVLLGAVATKAVLEESVSVLKVHGQILRKGKRKVFVTLHPAAAIRFQKFRKLLDKDFKRLKLLVNK